MGDSIGTTRSGRSSEKRLFVLLVGPPGSGKSRYVQALQLREKISVLNRDDIAFDVASRYGLKYNDLFLSPRDTDTIDEDGKGGRYVRGREKYGPVIDLVPDAYLAQWNSTAFSSIHEANEEIRRIYNAKMAEALAGRLDVYVDMINKNRRDRALQLAFIRDIRNEFMVKAIVFNKGGHDSENLLIRVNRKRDAELAAHGIVKFISEDVIRFNIERFELPSVDEGIDQLEFVDNTAVLTRFVEG